MKKKIISPISPVAYSPQNVRTSHNSTPQPNEINELYTTGTVLCDKTADDTTFNKYLDDQIKICEKNRDAYNLFWEKLSLKHNLVSVPLLIITSSTGVIASLTTEKTPGVIVGALSAVFAALQRYCAYAERAENARNVAKTYARIINKIKTMELLIESESLQAHPVIITKMLREIQSEIESVQEGAQEVPWDLLKTIDTVDSTVCCIKVKGTV